MIKYAKIYATELQPLCQEGEEIVDVISAMYNTGREREPDESNTVSFDPINGLDVERWNRAAERGIGGLTLDLLRGRQAAELARTVEASSFLVLTTRRFLVIDKLQGGGAASLKWSTGRDDIAAITHDPRLPLELGRLRLDFADGSMVRLWTGVLLPFAARRFAASFRRPASG